MAVFRFPDESEPELLLLLLKKNQKNVRHYIYYVPDNDCERSIYEKGDARHRPVVGTGRVSGREAGVERLRSCWKRPTKVVL